MPLNRKDAEEIAEFIQLSRIDCFDKNSLNERINNAIQYFSLKWLEISKRDLSKPPSVFYQEALADTIHYYWSEE